MLPYTYVIIPAADVTDVDFDEVAESNADTLRGNVDDTKTFVKFPAADPTPSFLDGMTQYTRAEMLTELAKPEWSPPFPE